MEKTIKIQSIIQDVIEGRKENNEATIDILALCDVSQQRELLEFFVETQSSELFKTQTGYKYKPNAIEETIKNFNCG